MTNDFFYRYVDELIGDEYSSSPRMRLLEFRVQKYTPKGAWLHSPWWKPKFVLVSGRKRFAHPTKEEALQSFIARKRRQISIYAARHDTAKEVLDQAIALVGTDLNKDPNRYWFEAMPLS